MYTIADISIWPWIYALYHIYDNAAEVNIYESLCNTAILYNIRSYCYTLLYT